MNVLMLATHFPYPPTHGGGLRVFNILKQAAKRHRVSFLAMHRPGERPKDSDRAAFGQWAADLRLVERPMGLPFRICNAAASLAGGRPYTIANFHFGAFTEAIAVALREQQYDLVHAHCLHTAQYYPVCGGLPVVFDCQNLNVWLWERFAGVQRNPLTRSFALRQAKLLRAFEPRVHRAVAATTMCSDAERDEALRWSPDAPITTLANGVDTEYFAPQPLVCEEADTVVFSASMDTPQNQDAAAYFVHRVLPLLRQRRPGVRVALVGRAPSPEVRALASESVTVTGTVDDVRPYIARAAVCIVPIRIGAGTRLKILEAMAMGKAVVSTAIGAEGIDYSNGDDIVIADEPDDMAEAVHRLLNDADARRRLGEAGRTLVTERYDWDRIGERLEAVYAQALRGRSEENRHG